MILKKELKRFLNKSDTTIWRWIKAGHFPAPVEIAPGSKAWLEADLDAWQESVLGDRVGFSPASISPDKSS